LNCWLKQQLKKIKNRKAKKKMSTNTIVMPVTAAALKEAAVVVEQIESLQGRLNALLNGEATVSSASTGRRGMGPKGRKAVSEAQKARWAKIHAEKAAKEKAATVTLTPVSEAETVTA